MSESSIDMDKGEKTAEDLLDKLDIRDMSMTSAEKALWVPKGEIQNVKIDNKPDYTWQADASKVISGYEYTFSHTIGGLNIDQMLASTVHDKSADIYAPPLFDSNIRWETQSSVNNY